MKTHKIIYHFKDGSSSNTPAAEDQMFPHEIAKFLEKDVYNSEMRVITNDGDKSLQEIKSIEIVL